MTMYGRTLHDDRSDHYGQITVKKALEVSSDVGAAKMALKMGPDTFYKYIRGFGFGDRSGIELPSETRGLLRAPRKWGSTSILSLAIGQEVGVTPVQLVTMVSAIANGGVYMPPHVLLQSTDEMKGDARLKPAAFHPENELPTQLPDGAHRVIKELTAAKMRAMMQGIVVEGTGKNAQLNGYSSAGKTGTAQKVDPVTHTYSHTKLVASFAGFAPVSSPAVSIAVVIDTPTVGSRYGAETSAPVFQKVAQQVLEYLGVPHDQPLKATKEMLASSKAEAADAPSENPEDLGALFDEVNSLPADDPLRQQTGVADAGGPAGAVAQNSPPRPATSTPPILNLLPKRVMEAFKESGGKESSISRESGSGTDSVQAVNVAPPIQKTGSGSVVVDPRQRVAVPSFAGEALRNVVETAANLGLRVETVGSGTARDQAPLAGTMVPLGTQVVVRFVR
jgi:cell division protein FtsI (penicillin-binding protein 3)